MFRVARGIPVVVVAPQAWFPGQALIRLFRPHFRPMARVCEVIDGIEVHRPRFLSFPGVFKRADGMLMAICSYLTVRRLSKRHCANLLDAHFGYPDGRAATMLGRWLSLPVMLTLRGKEERQMRTAVRSPLVAAIRDADRIITVSQALRDVAILAGADPAKVEVIGNGIDLGKFVRMDQTEARIRLGVPSDAQVLVSVGALVERKGFHRVIELLPSLVKAHPTLVYLIVGGAGPEGDMSARLVELAREAGVAERVRFLGAMSPSELKVPLSAADVFVLASSYEGWANVILEAMACGLPVVATDVGGNAEVVSDQSLGEVVPFGDAERLGQAISSALLRFWDRSEIRRHAEANSWDARMPVLRTAFERLLQEARLAGRT
jgi:glycosyltransferase involved in cell wall biosynthesis